MKRWRVGDAYDQAFDRLKTRYRLAPRLHTGIVQERVAGIAELIGRGLYCPGVLDLEFDAGLREWPAWRPGVGTEAGLRGLGRFA